MTTSTYVSGRGVLYRTDPRAKLLFLLLMCIWFFLPISLWGAWLVVAALVLTSLLSVGPKETRNVVLTILPMLAFMVLFMPLSERNSQALWRIGSLTVLTQGGLLQTLRLMSRFVGITFTCTLVLQTTQMADMMLALRWYRLPYKASLVVTLAFRFIPFIADSFTQIRESHKLRDPNVDEQEGKKRKGIRSKAGELIPTLTSALVVALRSIPTLAMSLEHRGFGLPGKRTSYRVLPVNLRLFTDLLISFIIPLILGFLFWVG